jgi:hypothetical protein
MLTIIIWYQKLKDLMEMKTCDIQIASHKSMTFSNLSMPLNNTFQTSQNFIQSCLHVDTKWTHLNAPILSVIDIY